MSVFSCWNNDVQKCCVCQFADSAEQHTYLLTYLLTCCAQMWRSSNLILTTFEVRMFPAPFKFVECFKHVSVECKFVEKSLFCDRFCMYKANSFNSKQVSDIGCFSFTHKYSQPNRMCIWFRPYIRHGTTCAYFRFQYL